MINHLTEGLIIFRHPFIIFLVFLIVLALWVDYRDSKK